MKIGYIAGLIDGEGYIGIKKVRSKDAVSPVYHERIQVRMIHEGAIKFLTKTLGGNYYCEKAHASNGRSLFCWQASDALASHILRRILPFLIVKKRVARTVLQLRASKEDPEARRRGSPAKRTMNPRILAHRESLYLRCKEINTGRG